MYFESFGSADDDALPCRVGHEANRRVGHVAPDRRGPARPQSTRGRVRARVRDPRQGRSDRGAGVPDDERLPDRTDGRDEAGPGVGVAFAERGARERARTRTCTTAPPRTGGSRCFIQRLGGIDSATTSRARRRVLSAAARSSASRVGADEHRPVLAPEPAGHAPATTVPSMIEAGTPGGGGVMTAATLARSIRVADNPNGLWKPDVLADATSNIRCTLPDPMMGLPANRTIGVVIGNGFGTTWGKSPTAYGWPGTGGQVGFAEPGTGVVLLVPAEWRCRPDERVYRDQDVGARARTGPLTPPRGRT